MSTFTQLLYHIVFSTKGREPTLDDHGRGRFFNYIHGLCSNRRCHLYCANCVDDHVHLLSVVRTTIPVAKFVGDIKRVSSLWIKNELIFPRFTSWQEGYGAFTISYAGRNAVIEFIKRQKEHHLEQSYLEEYEHMIVEAGLAIDKRYFS